VAWVDVSEVIHAFKMDSLNFMFTFSSKKLQKHAYDICAFHESKEVCNLWELLSEIVLWNLWTTRCSLVFKEKKLFAGGDYTICLE
jgi:hypothetical protein